MKKLVRSLERWQYDAIWKDLISQDTEHHVIQGVQMFLKTSPEKKCNRLQFQKIPFLM